MQRDPVTVERFYTEHAGELQLHLIAGASGLKRVIREPTVNRPGLVLSGFEHHPVEGGLETLRQPPA